MAATDRVVLPSCVVPIHYDIELTPDIPKLEFLGSESISVEVKSSTNEIQLHAKEIQVTSASFKAEGSGVTIQLAEVLHIEPSSVH